MEWIETLKLGCADANEQRKAFERIKELEKENKWFLEGLIEIHDWSCDELIRKIAEKYMGWYKHKTTEALKEKQ